jgi:hypothetical protein
MKTDNKDTLIYGLIGIIVVLLIGVGAQFFKWMHKEWKEMMEDHKMEEQQGMKEETPVVANMLIESSKMIPEVWKLMNDTTWTKGQVVWAVVTSDKKGNIVTPYEITLPKGGYEAIFRLKTDNVLKKEVLADVFIDGVTPSQESYSKEVSGKDFTKANEFTNISVKFNVNQDNTKVAPWVYYTGEASLWIDTIEIKKTDMVDYTISTTDNRKFEEEAFAHKVGTGVSDATAGNGKALIAVEWKDQAGHMAFGPYSKDELPGNHKATFMLKYSDNTYSGNVARLEVFNTNGNGVNKSLIIKGNEFKSSNAFQPFDINYIRTDIGDIEYRVYYYGKGSLTLDSVLNLGEYIKTAEKAQPSAVSGIPVVVTWATVGTGSVKK